MQENIRATTKDRIKKTIRCGISPHDPGLRPLVKELAELKNLRIAGSKLITRKLITDNKFNAHSQQKWMLDTQLKKFLKNLPFHPYPFHNQAIYLESRTIMKYSKKEKKDVEYTNFFLHLKTMQGEESVYALHYDKKYIDDLLLASSDHFPTSGEIPTLGQSELIEDHKTGWINAHLVLRLPKPKTDIPNGWLGIDVGWNNLAVSSFVGENGEAHHVTFHGTIRRRHQREIYKTTILRLKYLLRQTQRKGKTAKIWNNRLQNTIKYAVGTIAKEIVEKAKRFHAGIAMEILTFQSSTKRYLIPRYKLKCAIANLCEREGIPFKLVSARDTSQICNRCNYKDKKNRNGKIFKCLNCGYTVHADINASINIAKRAKRGLNIAKKSSKRRARGDIGVESYMPTPKGLECYMPQNPGVVATPQAINETPRMGCGDRKNNGIGGSQPTNIMLQ